MGKCSLFMTEQLRLQQFLGDGATVDRYKSIVVTETVPMQSANQQLLACTGFTSHQHGAVRGRNLLKDPEDLGKDGAVPDDTVQIKRHLSSVIA